MMADVKPGDRFEIALTGLPDRLALPAVLGPDGFAIEQIEDAEGRPVESALDWAANLLIVPKLAQVDLAPGRLIVAGIPGTGPFSLDRGAGIVDSGQWRAGYRAGCSHPV